MAQLFNIVEFVKPFTLDTSQFTFYAPFVVFSQMTTGSDFADTSYFTTTFAAKDETNKTALNIKSIIYDLTTLYARTDNLADCLDEELSFYFDIPTQTIYIHVDHDVNFFSGGFEYGKVYGYTNDQVRDFNGIPYLPEVISIPSFNLAVDPLQYQMQGFTGGSIVFKNDLSQWDGVTGIFGNDIYIYVGEEGDDYSDLTMIAYNYITNVKRNFSQCVLETKDRREQQNKKVPIDTFTLADYPSINTDYVGKVKPDAYGACRGVPGICVNENVGNNPKTFYFASQITGTPTFYHKVDDKWAAVVAASIDNANGTATFSVANSHVDGDFTKGLLEFKATGTFRNYNNPADIIADMNDRFLGIVYNVSNYDTTEWEDEKQYLDDVGLYMPDQRNLFEWFEKLQAGSTVGFMTFFYNGKRTMRLDNPNRDTVLDVPAVLMVNNGNLEEDENGELFSTHARIQYNQDHKDDLWESVENNDYYDEVYAEYRKDKQYDEDSLLTTEGNADDRAVIIMEDQKDVRPIVPIILFGKEFFDLRLFDIINAELSYPGEVVEQEQAAHWYLETDGTGDTLIDGDTTDERILLEVDDYQWDIIENDRYFMGWQRMQIIGISPVLNQGADYGNIELKCRQREYSEAFADITGYIP